MESKLVELQNSLKSLSNKFSQLSEQLSEATKKLKTSLIPPSFALAEQIVSERQRFEELRNQVVQLAQSFEVIITDIEKIISIQDIEVILNAISEAEQTESKTSKKALDILKKISEICYIDRTDFHPLQQCLAQAKE